MECTFHPVTNNKKPKSYVPLQNRAMEIQLAKRERLLKQKEDAVDKIEFQILAATL